MRIQSNPEMLEDRSEGCTSTQAVQKSKRSSFCEKKSYCTTKMAKQECNIPDT